MRRESLVFRAGIAAVLLAALALSGCGRRGALEAPPGASVTGTLPEPPAETTGSTSAPSTEPEKPNKRIPLDILL